MKLRPIFVLLVCGAFGASSGCGEIDDGGADGITKTESALVTFTAVPLVNGWVPSSFGTAVPASALVDGKVYLRGAMQSGTAGLAFTLPLGRRPSTNVYLPVNLVVATKGRLLIQTTGAVTVVAEGGTFSNAQSFTSLDGVSFAVNNAGYTNLALQNGWTASPFSTRPPAVRNVNGVIHFQGAMATTGSNAQPFVLPLGFAPSTNAYLPLDTFAGTKGRLFVNIGGQVSIVGENGVFTNAKQFTSLEGLSYPLNPAGDPSFMCFTPINGWVGMPFSTRMPCLKNFNGIVRLMGAVSTTGANPVPLILPVGFRPTAQVYIEADMFQGKQGRLIINTSGQIQVQGKVAFSDASQFTSFEGAFFAQ